MCEAGPGSGKTECLVERAAQMLRAGVSYDGILVLSFTAEAAKQLRNRLEKKITVPPTKRLAGMLTYHSWALNFCAEEHENFPFTVLSNPLATEGQCAKKGYELASKFDVNYRVLRSWISLQKRNRVSPVEALEHAEKINENQSLALAYKKYDAWLYETGCLDFDSLILEAVKLLETRPNIRAKYQYRFLMSDEFQDTDAVQYSLLKLLSEKHLNVLVVGDKNQMLYSWRGADASIFNRIAEDYPETQTIYLGRNYRSTKKIVDYVKSIAPASNLIEHFTTDNEEGSDPEIHMYSTPQREAEEVVEKVRLFPDKSAVLARTNGALRAVEDALINAGVKYHYLGDSGFYNRSEVKNALAYIQCASAVTDNALAAAIRSPFFPSKYIKKKQTLDAIKHPDQSAWTILTNDSTYAIQEFVKFIRSITRYRYSPAKDAVAYILRDLKALEYYNEEEAIDSDNNPVENLKELQRVAAKYSDLREFLNFIRKVQAASKSRKGCVLSTIHGFKGRQAMAVYLVQCSEGMLPHKRSANIDEEQNAFYVAASRPEKFLHISYTGEPSRFLKLGENKDGTLSA